MTLDAEAIVRRIKPERRLTRLRPRPAAALVGVADIVGGRARMMPDTNVYIHSAAGWLSGDTEAVLDAAVTTHCTTCLAELMTGIGNANPAHARWTAMRDHYLALIATVPDHRLLAPDDAVWAEAGLIAGTLARVQGYQPHQRKECLNDALIYLTAAKAGVAVLTSNRDEFDLIQQVAGRGSFVHY